MRHRSAWLLSPALLATTLTSTAAADSFSYTRSNALVEKEHQVQITLRRDHAELKVTRVVHNGGERPDQATFEIMTGTDAIAVGLRTQAIVDGKPKWFQGELMEAEAAAKKYTELTGLGGAYPKDPALLSWRTPGHLKLQVFPCMAKEDKTVEYTMLVPMRYAEGRHVLDLPAMGTKGVIPKATVTADAGGILVDGRGAPANLRLGKSHRIEQAVDQVDWVAGDLGVVPFAADKALFGYHFDIAARISEVPDKARVVVLIDGSHSFGAENMSAARAAASSYLSHFDGSDVEASVLSFARKVESLTSGFESVDAARKALSGKAVKPQNGSEIGVALERAGALLATAPAGIERRIVLFTDLRTRATLDPERTRAFVPGGATLHIATLSTGDSASLSREDEEPWAKLPRSTGGLLWHASSSDDASGEDNRREVFEELARPMRLDRVTIVAPGLEDLEVPSVLVEGEGIEAHRITDKYVSFMSLRGELWSRPVSRTLEPDAGYGRRRAALAFGTSLVHGLQDKELMTLALYGRAVSPVTSYLAIEPGVRPSTEGLERDNMWGDQIGDAFGAGGVGLAGFGSGGGGLGERIDFEGLLAALLRPGLKPCGATAREVSGEVESTGPEIVAVKISVSDDAKGAKASCLTEHAWGALLPAPFARRDRTTRVKL